MKNVTVKDPINQILSEENLENVVMFDDENKPIEFEQVAVIPLENDELLYAILIPVTPMQGVEEGEGVLFAIDEEKGNMDIERDEATIDEVLSIYQALIEGGDDENK